MTIPIVVVNLEGSQERRRFMEEQLNLFGLPYEFLNAVDGNQLTDADLPLFLGESGVMLLVFGLLIGVWMTRIYQVDQVLAILLAILSALLITIGLFSLVSGIVLHTIKGHLQRLSDGIRLW